MKKDFNNLITTFKSSIKTWDYFVNWNKVFSNSSELEIALNKLNYLLGKENLKEEFIKLYSSNACLLYTSFYFNNYCEFCSFFFQFISKERECLFGIFHFENLKKKSWNLFGAIFPNPNLFRVSSISMTMW